MDEYQRHVKDTSNVIYLALSEHVWPILVKEQVDADLDIILISNIQVLESPPFLDITDRDSFNFNFCISKKIVRNERATYVV